jgi:N-acetylmuramoyl-L-alanine amidase
MNLSIAKKIKKLAPGYNIQAILTREKDELPGNIQSISDGLSYRTTLAEKYNADLFISIHINNEINASSASGFEINISNRKSQDQKSIALGSALVSTIGKSYSINPQLKKPDQGIRVLDKSIVPAVLIECGYLTNQKDLAFISGERNQEKIATNILEGIVRFNQKN